MTKILFIIPYVPYPLDSGGNQAFYNMVDYLRHKMSVSVLMWPESGTMMRRAQALQQRWDNVEFFLYQKQEVLPAVKHPHYYRLLQKASASLGRKMRRQRLVQTDDGQQDLVRERTTLYPSLFNRFDEGYVNYVSEVARRGFDIIQVEFYELLSLGYLLPQDVQTIFVHHELRYIRNEKELTLFKEHKPEDRMLFNIARDYERNALRTYKHIIALTETDRRILKDFLGEPCSIYASPAVIHVPERREQAATGSLTHRLTFVGTESHFPNLDAIDWFCREIAPELRRKGFKFTLQVTGSWYSAYVDKLKALCPELKVMGYVEDLASFMKGSLAIVPIRIGSGMRMKILEAVFAQVPFVTTTKGVEGLDFRSGEECLVADTAEGFASAIVELAGHPDLQTRLAGNADERLRQLYNPQEMLERRWEVYQEILRNNT